ncbi:MAG: MFS transporter, partial [Gammaproteobacteria bacterium HGW-Gammaproteobacteria-9]
MSRISPGTGSPRSSTTDGPVATHSQFRLLGKRRFLPFFCTQLLGAFNDNVFKQALILA